MSDMELNKGKLIPFEMTEEIAKHLVEEKEGLEDNLDDCYSSYLEQLKDDYSWYTDDLVLINDNFYKVKFEIERGELYGFADVKVQKNGTIKFHTYHYNGGAHWTEVVERKLNEK